MRSNGLQLRMTGLALAVTMVAAVGPATEGSGVARAAVDDRYYDRYDGRYDDRVRWDREREKRYAFLLGYHTGYSEGRDSRYYRINYKDMPGYRDGMNGWLAWMGDRDTYRKSYRDGYEDGFKDGRSGRVRRYDRDDVERALGGNLKSVYDDDHYDDDHYDGRGRGRGNGHGRYDDNWGRYDRDQVRRLAYQNGHNWGLRHGREDQVRRRGYDYDHADAYRDASAGYRSEYGNREFYRQSFREGYRRGYDEGYRGASGQRRWPF